MELAAISRERFFAAVQSGDARAIAAFFAQRASTASDGDGEVDPREGRAGHEWLRPFTHETRFANPNSLLAIAIRCHYVDVLEWTFSTDAIATIGPQPLVAALEAACHFAMCVCALAETELLLETPVFTQLLPDTTRQELLDRLLCLVQENDSPSAVRLLTAHGARVNLLDRESPVLLHAVRRPDLTLFDAIIRDGVTTVGARVLDNVLSGPEALRPLAEFGLLPVAGGWPLQCAVSEGSLEKTKFWLDDCFVDVDTRLVGEQTPLMHVSHEVAHRPSDRCPRAEVTKLLLDYGASVSAKDVYGRTPLHHAVGCCDAEIIRLLLEYGADPNEPNRENYVALDLLNLNRLDNPLVSAQLGYLLKYGAKPPSSSSMDTFAVDRQQQCEDAMAFITRRGI